MEDLRKEWEYEVTITKYRGKWEANDGIDYEVANGPEQALEDLWEMVKDRVEKEYLEMMVETKWDELRGCE